MRIGIYKSGFPIYFSPNPSDHAAISVEIIRIVKILANHSNEVYILSDTDYIPGSLKNVSKEVPESLDKVFIYNGKGLTSDIVDSMCKLTSDVNLIVTDLSLKPSLDIQRKFNKMYSQSYQWGTYGAIEQHECFEYTKEKYDKSIPIYFGGTERGRTADFLEYVYRPNVKWHGKSDTLGIKNYIPYAEHLEMMKKARYSIVIGDEAYNEVGFITPRYYECIRYDVIAFVDMKYDPDEILIKKTDFRRVSSYIQMLKKIELIEEYPEVYVNIIKAQQQEITSEMKTGENIYNKLIL